LNYFERRNYSRDLARVPAIMESALYRTTPYLVVQPKAEEDIVNILAFCRANRLRVFPRGTGSFAFGGAVPTRKGVVIDLSPMMSILEINPQKQTVRLQPGARWADVATKLEAYGLVPKTTPTSRFSTVAGWISTGGMGVDSYAYGPVSDSVLSVRVIRADGSIDQLNSKNKRMKDLFGTEGQLGILTEVILSVRPKPAYSGACLLTFKSPGQAFGFLKKHVGAKCGASHVVYFDREYMKHENTLFSEHLGKTESIVPESDAVLFHFESQDSEEKFLSSINGKLAPVSRNRTAARFLWSERYFPLKAQRIGPGLLGAEVVIPRDEVSKYISRVRNYARHFGIEPTVEVIVCRDGKHYMYLVIISFSCDYTRFLHYSLSLMFIQLLVRLAVRCGGYPYGIGIWNSPYIGSKFGKKKLARLIGKKQRMDPRELLNPNKFFKIKGRFFGIPAFFFRPVAFRTLLAAAHVSASVLGLITKILKPPVLTRWDVPSKEDKKGKSLLQQCSLRCTSCGSCISVCPAYHIAEDELVTGRAKLRMAEAMEKGVRLRRSEAHALFQCLHCGLCEEVCQTRLPLRECYLVMEEKLEKRFGQATETVQAFVEKLDSNRDYIKDIFGLDLPDWSPEKPLARVPAVERPPMGGER
jgi:FAD/FMN-containing dehydrogenase/ferredoxin